MKEIKQATMGLRLQDVSKSRGGMCGDLFLKKIYIIHKEDLYMTDSGDSTMKRKVRGWWTQARLKD